MQFQFPAAVPLREETHGGEDVGLWATGPMSSLFTGTIDNTYVAHAIVHALCLNKQRNCPKSHQPFYSPPIINSYFILLSIAVVFSFGSFLSLLVLLGLKIYTICRPVADTEAADVPIIVIKN